MRYPAGVLIITGFCNDTNAGAEFEAVRFVKTLPP